MDQLKIHEKWMGLALKLAKKAAEADEVPVGAVLVGPDQNLISTGFNRRESLPSPIAHAELIALHKGARKLKTWRMIDCTLYVTLEPCVMCSGALVQSRVGKVVFGANDPKGGGLTSLYQIGGDPRLNHQFEIIHGIRETECSEILKKFFKIKREQKKNSKFE